MATRRSARSRQPLTQPSSSSKPEAPSMTRSTRRAASGNANPSVTVARSPSQSPDSNKKSIRLTVKMPSNKLREATSGGKPSVALHSRERFEGGEIITGPRNSRAKRPIVEESESEEEEDEEELEEEEDDVRPNPRLRGRVDDDEEDDDQDAEGEDDDQHDEDMDDDEADAEGESVDDDAEEDTYMDDALLHHPPAPTIRMTAPSKPSLIVTPTPDDDDDDDDDDAGDAHLRKPKRSTIEDDVSEELSDLDSDGAGNNDDDLARGALERDGGGDDDDVDMDDEEDDDVESDGTPRASESRGSTPDMSKMTKRQQSRLNRVMGSDFLQLPMEPQIKKHLTAEEHAMRRAEMARRRKNLSEKRNEEEKMDTINRLLKKQAPKRRGKISAAELSAAHALGPSPLHEQNGVDPEPERAEPVFVRWVHGKDGSRVGIPEEWDGTMGVGMVFGVGRGAKMVEEVG